jgi:type VI secretion system secreted protein Hcp
MAIYMEYEGLKGNVTAAGYEGMIALDFLAFGIERKIGMEAGALANRESTKPAFSVLVTGKRFDGASLGILREAVGANTGRQVKIHFVRTGNHKLQEFMTYTFQRCLPTLYRIVDTRSETSAAAERLYLSYTSVEVSYTDSGADNKALGALRYGYDLAAARSL